MNKFFADRMQRSAERALNRMCSICGRSLYANPPHVDDPREFFPGMRKWEMDHEMHFICYDRMRSGEPTN